MIEPLAVAVHGVKQMGDVAGMNIEDTEMSEAMEQYYKENSGLYDISKLI